MKECVNSGKVNFFFFLSQNLLIKLGCSSEVLCLNTYQRLTTLTNYSTTKTGTKVGKSVTEILNAIAPH